MFNQFCYDQVYPEDQVWVALVGKEFDVRCLGGSLGQTTSHANATQRAAAAQEANNKLLESTSFLGYLMNRTFLLTFSDGGSERYTFSRYSGQVTAVSGTLTLGSGTPSGGCTG